MRNEKLKKHIPNCQEKVGTRCRMCKVTCYVKDFELHFRKHFSPDEAVCSECRKVFPSNNALKSHKKMYHSNFNKDCTFCKKSFYHSKKESVKKNLLSL